MARPKFKIDYNVVEKLGSIMCTEREIANFLGCDERTLQRDKEFCRIYKKSLDKGRMSLRRMQWKLAEKNTTMAIFLGKNYLGQKDVVEQSIEDKNGIIDDLIGALNNVKKTE